MAQLVVGAIGAAIGGAALPAGLTLFGSTISGAALGWTAGQLLYGATQKSKTVAPQISDLRVSGVGYGQVVPWLAGSPRTAGTLIWASEKRPIPNKQKAGKGGGSSYTSWTYAVDLLYMVSENPLDRIDRIFRNGELVYAGGTVKSGVWSEVRVYTGVDTQLPDPTYEAAVGVGNAPAYRGRGTVLLRNVQLDSSGQIPNFTFVVNSEQYAEFDSDVLLMLRFNESVNSTDFFDSSIYQHEVINRDPATKYTTSSNAIQGNALRSLVNSGVAPVQATLGAVANIGDSDFTFEGSFVLNSLSSGVPFSTPIFRLFMSGGGALSQIVVGQFGSGSGASPIPSDLVAGERYYFRDERDGNQRTVTLSGNFASHPSTTAVLFTETIVGSWPVNFSGVNGVEIGGADDSVFRSAPDATFDEIRLSRKVQPNPPQYPLEIDTTLSPGDPNYGTAALYDVVNALCLRAGLEEDEFDVTGIEDINVRVDAMYLSQISSTRAALEILANAYYFTVSKSDKLYFKFRKVAVDGVWSFEDIGFSENPNGSENPFPINIGNQLEQTSQIVLSYNNMAADFNPATVSSDILTTIQQSTSQIQMPLGFFPSKAKGFVESALIDQQAALTRFGPVRAPIGYAKYEPSDVVTIPDHTGREFRVRLTKKTDLGIMMEFEGVGDDAGALVAAGIADDTNQGQVDVEQPSGSAWVALDLPMLRDADNSPGWYAVAGTKGDGDYWPGGGFYRSWDDLNFSLLAELSESATFGECDTALGDFTGGNRFDGVNDLVVTVNGELSSSNFTTMISDLTVNVAAVGVDGAWEIIRFKNATLLAPGQYRLSGLIRGFRGTEWAMGGHTTDDKFVLLNENTLRFTSEFGQIGVIRYVKAVTAALPLTSETATPFTDTGVVLKPFSPVDLVILRQPNDDALIDWRRRTRLSYRFLTAGIDPPIGEASELYDVEIWDSGFANLLRTFDDVTESEQLYTAAEQTADYGSIPATIYIRVYQKSALVGRGYKLEAQG